MNCVFTYLFFKIATWRGGGLIFLKSSLDLRLRFHVLIMIKDILLLYDVCCFILNPRHLEAYVRAESYDHVQGDEISLSDPVVAITDCIWVRMNYLG